METVKKFQADFTALKKVLAEVDKADNKKKINELDQRIGVTLHALQYGVGAMAIEIKKHVDEKKASL